LFIVPTNNGSVELNCEVDKIKFFCDVKSCRLVNISLRLGGLQCHNLQGQAVLST